jgi:hypothetical protein
MSGLFHLFDTDGFPPRWHCGTAWQQEPSLGWIHIGSDVAIWFAYMSIPAVLAYFVIRRRDVTFPRIFWLFVAFIFACGTGHLVEAVIFWWPVYRLSGVIKLFTAAVSLATVGSLFAILPRALDLPGMAETAGRLQQENQERRRAEERLARLNEQLSSSMHELEQFNRLAIGREERMIELKREVNTLAQELGRREPYDLSFTESAND